MDGLVQSGIEGARKVLTLAETLFDRSYSEKGGDVPIAFPDTAYYLPMIYAHSGMEIKKIKDLDGVFLTAKRLLDEDTDEFSKALNAGMATLLLAEGIAAIRYLRNEEPQRDCEGFFTDSILRSLGLQLAGGKISGFALIIGSAPDTSSAVEMIRDFQGKNLVTFAGGKSAGLSIIDQLKEGNIEMGWDNYLVPYGRDIISAIYPVNWAVRVALTFGALKGGDRETLLKYTRERIPAVGVKLGEITPEEVAFAWGAINLGFPVVVHADLPSLTLPGICKYEAVKGEPDIRKIPEAALQIRGIKIKVKKIPIPVSYSDAFQGERVRREDTYVEFGGQYSTSFEFLTMRALEEIQDGKIEVEGKEINEMTEGEAYPLSLLVEVAGRKMQRDYEPILERQLHSFINSAEGIFHIGQRDTNWIRVSKEAQRKGFRLQHLGVIIHARLHEDFGNVIDKAQIKISSVKETVEGLLETARKTYQQRDERMAGITDEGVEEFYTCTLCQSFAPHHVCIVKPERLGLCGAYNWLDCKISYDINPRGPNQPVKKGKIIDPMMGEWEGINRAIQENSKRKLERFHAYSIMTFPETSCGCFECIVAYIPETNGFMIVNRQYLGMTPSGMTFTTLAGSVGGGQQVPGFAGIGRLYIVSRKFLKADGGINRIVWMTRELKEFLGEKFKKRSEEEGVPDLMEKIADEDIATTLEELLAFLGRVRHPVLTMEPLM
jgi:acetyl-CoA synthase